MAKYPNQNSRIILSSDTGFNKQEYTYCYC